jgi:hypothetical protein
MLNYLENNYYIIRGKVYYTNKIVSIQLGIL